MRGDPAINQTKPLQDGSLVIGVRGTTTLVERINRLRGTLTISLFCRHAIQHFCDAVDADDPAAQQRIQTTSESRKQPDRNACRPPHAAQSKAPRQPANCSRAGGERATRSTLTTIATRSAPR
jgi:hypothetical protein